MCDIFTQKDLLERLAGKSYLFIGDSIMRNLYKDLVWLTTNEREEFIPTRHMQKKGKEFCNRGRGLSAAIKNGV